MLNFIISPEKIILKEEQDILKSWREYENTFQDKQSLILRLPYTYGERKNISRTLKNLIATDLADLKIDEQNDIIERLRSFRYEERMRELARIHNALAFEHSRREYIHGLMSHLFITLRQEYQLCVKIDDADIREYRKIADSLAVELAIERDIIKKVGDRERFEKIFIQLVRGEYIIAKMDAEQKRLLGHMKDRMEKIFSRELREGETYIWARAVLDALKGRMKKALEAGTLDPNDDPEREFVNRPEFVTLSRDAITAVREKKRLISERMLAAFVYYFREWYNSLE